MDDLEQLYRDLLIDHYKHPRNRTELREEEVLTEAENPLCGDQVRLAVRIEGGRLTEIRHDGKGCVISQASVSMMSEALTGCTVDEARALIATFIEALRGERPFDSSIPEDLHALRGVVKFPLRVKCATLGWHGLEKALAILRERPEKLQILDR